MYEVADYRPEKGKRGQLEPDGMNGLRGDMENSIDWRGRILSHHGWKDCLGPNCPIHKPSDHHMLDWPLLFRPDLGIFERICEHGIGHDDPDSTAYAEAMDPKWYHPHGCDGCCSEDYVPIGIWSDEQSS